MAERKSLTASETIEEFLRTFARFEDKFLRDVSFPLDPDVLVPTNSLFTGLASVLKVSTLPISSRHAPPSVVDCLSPAALKDTPEDIRKEVLASLLYGLAALGEGISYRPQLLTLRGKKIAVHNSLVTPLLKETYSASSIWGVLEELEARKTFEAPVDSTTGLIRMGDTPLSGEVRVQGTADTVISGYWQRVKDPEGWKKSLLVNAAFTLSPSSLAAFAKVMRSPAWFRETAEDGSYAATNGMPHRFLLGSIQFSDDGTLPIYDRIESDPLCPNYKCIEAQALLLWALVQNLIDGCTQEEVPAYAFNPLFLEQEEQAELVLRSISVSANYLFSVNTDPSSASLSPRFDFAAPSGSAWEEQPFDGGVTWDTAATVLAFEALFRLLFHDDWDDIVPVQKIRSLLKATSHGGLFLNRSLLKSFIKAGRAQVTERITKRLQKNLHPKHSEERELDASLLFLAASHYRLVPDVLENAELYLRLLTQCEQSLLRSHGMIRFASYKNRKAEIVTDSYLGIGYRLPDSLRTALVSQMTSTEQTEAQWALGVSSALQGLCWLAEDVAAQPEAQDSVKRALLARLDQKIDEYISRNLALLSPEGGIRASNGRPAPAWKVMETYEAIPQANSLDTSWLPGAYSSARGMAQLYDALKRAWRWKSR